MRVVRFGRSPGILALALVSAATVVGVGTTMAFAAPASGAEHHKALTCTPNNVNVGGGCQLTFKDGNEAKSYGGRAANANQQVCFSVDNAADHVYGQTGNCSMTDNKGNAYAVFSAGSCGSATITATEAAEPGEPNGTATKSVVVKGGNCPKPPKH